MTQVNWANQVDGAFADAADWKGGKVPTASDNALLEAPGATDYTVTSLADQTVNSIQTGSTATLAIAGFAAVDASYTFTVSNGTGSGANAGAVEVGDGARLAIGGDFDNAGAIAINGDSSTTFLDINKNATLSGAGQLTLSDDADNFIQNGASVTTLTNVDNTISGAGTISNGLVLVNQSAGIINATGTNNALVLNTGPKTITNAGLIETTGAAGMTINSAVANTGQLKASGSGALIISNYTVTNTGGGVLEAGAGAEVKLQGATIDGGALETTGAGAVYTEFSTLNGATTTAGAVTNQGLVDVSGLTLEGAIVNEGTIALNGVATLGAATLTVAKNATLSGAGQVLLSDSSANYIYGAPGATNFDNTISGAGGISGELLNKASGVIDATGANNALILSSNEISNAGLIETTGAAGLDLTIYSTLTNTGTLAADGSGALVIGYSAAVNNAGGTVSTAKGGHISLQGGTISGGAVTIAVGANLSADSGTNLVAAATLANAGMVAINDGQQLGMGGSIVNGGTIALEGATGPTTLAIAQTTSLAGGGAVILSDSADNAIVGGASATTLTNVDNTISGAGTVGSSMLTLVNAAAGVIDATGTSNPIILDTGANHLTNAGLVETTGAAGLTLEAAVVNTGTLEALGSGAMTLSGATVANTGGVVTDAKGGHISLQGATITGGTVTNVAGADITADAGANLITAATFTNAGTVTINGGEELGVGGVIDNGGTIALDDSGYTELIISENTSLKGRGDVYLSDRDGNLIVGGPTTATLTNTDNTISGAGTIGSSTLILDNESSGVIDGNGTENPLILVTPGHTIANAGLIEAASLEPTSVGGLVIRSAVANTGQLVAKSFGALTISQATITNIGKGAVSATIGGTITLAGGTITGGSLRVDSNSTLTAEVGTNDVLSPATFTNAGIVLIKTGADLKVGGLITNSQSIKFGASTTPTFLTLAQDTTLSGAGLVYMQGGAEIVSDPAATTLTNLGNTIYGAGTIAPSALINQAGGEILASGSGHTVVLNTGSNTIISDGLIAATDGGVMIIWSPLANAGKIKVGPGGRLDLEGGGFSSAGLINVESGGTLRFTSGNFILNAGALSGKGAVEVTANAILSVGEGQVVLPNITQDAGGIISIVGSLTVTGSVTLDTASQITGGENALLQTGAGVTLFKGATSEVGGGVLNIDGDHVFDNEGTFDVSGGSSIGLGSNSLGATMGGGTFDNSAGATCDLESATVIACGEGTCAVDNAGTLEQTAKGQSIIQAGIDFTNTGAVDVESGALKIDAACTNGDAGVLSASAGATLALDGTNILGGTLEGGGSILIGGPTTFTGGVTLSAESFTIDDTTLTLGTIAGPIPLYVALDPSTLLSLLGAADLLVSMQGAVLDGGGTVMLTEDARITGADSGATLTNDDKIKGSGQLGDGTMTLDNAAGALIEGTGSVALTINTGGNLITNSGTIQAASLGGVTISSALLNKGVLIANLGTLDVLGAVTGVGTVRINGGTADFTSAFSENVDFTGTKGVLELSQAYSGKVTGLSTAGTNSIDLLDVAFAGTTTGVYTGTTTSGVLTVTEGASVATIHLVGDYLGSTFTLSAGPGNVGTVIADPTTASPGAAPTTTHQFIAAMAGFGPPGGGSVSVGPHPWRTPPPTIVASRALA